MESIFLLPKTKGVFDMELKAIQLTKQYGSKTAVNHLNLSLSNGVYGLLGANGAGKTTLMRLLCDIQTPTSGKITLDGKNISVLGEKYRNLLGYLPQQFGYYPDFTAWDFLMYVAALKGLSEKQAHKKATELLEAVDLAEKRNLKIKTFSGGMKQRLGIAQAMLNNPRILILDEPTAGLDVEARNEILDLLREYIAQDEKRTILITSHISTDLESLCDDIYLIHDGKIILHEDTDVILEQYGILKVDEEQYRTLDKTAVIKAQKETYGYACFTNDRRFYQENYPQIVVEHGGIDELILMMTGGYR